MNGKASLGTTIVSLAILTSATASVAQEYTYDSGYVRVVDGTVSVQRALDPEPEPGEVNLPVLPGDRVWTGTSSFAEIRLSDGNIVRLGETTKVDFVAFGDEPTVLLWNGSIIVRTGVESARLRVDTPSGSAHPQQAGTFRVDVVDGITTTVSVLDGVAELGSEQGSVLIAAGERSSLEAGAHPREPFAFDVTHVDGLDTFSRSNDREAPRRRTVELADVPPEVHHYVEDLSDYGTWQEDETYGSVWYPTSVGYDWAPYRNGRWCYTSYGYTWVSYEPWGWAPSHYGRWGYGHSGWYWVPGRHWGPAWVSIAVGPTWIGWSPLGYHGGSVFAYDHGFYGSGHYPYYKGRPYYRGGRAVPRHVYDHGAGWNFSRKENFGRRGRARLRAADVRSSSGRARVHSSGAVLDRGMRAHAIGADNTLARRTPRARPAVSRESLRQSARRARGRAIERSSAGSRTSARGAERSLAERQSRPGQRTDRGPDRRSEATRERTEARSSSSRQRARSRVFRAPGTARSTGARGGPVDGARATEGRTSRERGPTARSRSSRSRDGETQQPRTRGQEFFEGSTRGEAVRGRSSRARERTRNRTRSSRPERGTPGSGSETTGRNRTRGGERATTTRPPRSQQRSSGRVARPRGGSRSTGTSRVGGSGGSNRGSAARSGGGSRAQRSRGGGSRGTRGRNN